MLHNYINLFKLIFLCTNCCWSHYILCAYFLRKINHFFLVIFKDKTDLKPNGIYKPEVGKVWCNYFFLIFWEKSCKRFFYEKRTVHYSQNTLHRDNNCVALFRSFCSCAVLFVLLFLLSFVLHLYLVAYMCCVH